jgi:hypothetical protein
MTDLDTTAWDGAACCLCGEDSTGYDTIGNARFPTCDACHHDEVATCSHCEYKLWQAEGVRLEGRRGDLFHPHCAAQIDEEYANQVRR